MPDTVKQFMVHVAIRDEPGAIHRIARQLAAWHINVEGLVADPAGLRFIGADHRVISQALDEMGYLYRVQEVHKVTLDNRPGVLAEVSGRLFDAGVNIESAFGAADNLRANVFVAVDDWERAGPILDLYGQSGPVVHPRLGRIG